jgi:ubiquinone biosynthesis protein COQ9
MQQSLCAAALPHVQALGWSQAALVAGANDLGLSPAIIGILPRKESNLVEHFIQQQNAKLVDELQQRQADLLAMRTPQRISAAVQLRLEMLIPYINAWPQALAILARPRNTLPALQLLASLVDDIWYAAGDKSVDASWYTKRLLLAGVYSSTELYMLTDFSPGFQDTWAHLDRRLQDVATLGKAVAQVSSLSSGLLDVLGKMRQHSQEDAPAHDGGTEKQSSNNSSSSSTSTSDWPNKSTVQSPVGPGLGSYAAADNTGYTSSIGSSSSQPQIPQQEQASAPTGGS